MSSNSILQRVLKQVIYDLKRKFGAKVTIYQLASSTTDYDTGAITTSRTSQDVQKCIVLPSNVARDLFQGANFLRASNAFASKGHHWTQGERGFIFAKDDLPTFNMATEDWIVYNGDRYDIQKFEEIEDLGWLVVGIKVEGSEPDEDFRVAALNAMNISDSAVNS